MTVKEMLERLEECNLNGIVVVAVYNEFTDDIDHYHIQDIEEDDGDALIHLKRF